MDDDFAAQVAGVAALAEPLRRDLYRYVVSQPGPVSRDQAAEGVALPRHTVKFHLDRLVQDGLLETEFRRLSGRQGPGAGRPTKLYRRSARAVSVTLPERHYDLAAQLLAEAIDVSTRDGLPVESALHEVARGVGVTWGAEAREGAGPSGGSGSTDPLWAVLEGHGYEPREEDGTVTLANCPFDRLARTHTALVCGMNLALLGAAARSTSGSSVTADLQPRDGRCCVVFREH